MKVSAGAYSYLFYQTNINKQINLLEHMINQISQEIKEVLSNYSEDDSLIFNNNIIKIDKSHFNEILASNNEQTVAFIDGGEAEIISAGNFSLSFIRIASVTFKGNNKINHHKKEFYLFTKAKYQNNDLVYESKIYGDKLIDEQDLLISSNDSSIKIGSERAPLSKVTNMARRFAELSLAAQIDADFVVIDGTLEKTFNNEEKYLQKLNNNVSALAKSCSLFTTSGNSPVVLLNKIGSNNCWSYFVNENTYFVKLNEKAKHVFRFSGNNDVLSHLTNNSKDALFLGYPYGLIFVDQQARVSNKEKKSLMMQFLLKKENKEIIDYLNTANAHSILDNLG